MTATRCFFIAILLLASTESRSQTASATFDAAHNEVSNWRAEAVLHLGFTQANFDRVSALRCVKLNNYWCLKDVGWLGGIGHDSDRHTAFENGDMAARAAVRNFRTAYVTNRRLSAFDLMSAYAPPDDCVGSAAARRADGSCIYGLNPTADYAKQVAVGITEDPKADLVLFDAGGVATEHLIIFLRNIVSYELAGAHMSEDSIRTGICLENNTCVR